MKASLPYSPYRYDKNNQAEISITDLMLLVIMDVM